MEFLDKKITVTDEEDVVYAAIVARKEIVEEEEVADEQVIDVEPVVEA